MNSYAEGGEVADSLTDWRRISWSIGNGGRSLWFWLLSGSRCPNPVVHKNSMPFCSTRSRPRARFDCRQSPKSNCSQAHSTNCIIRFFEKIWPREVPPRVQPQVVMVDLSPVSLVKARLVVPSTPYGRRMILTLEAGEQFVARRVSR